MVKALTSILRWFQHWGYMFRRYKWHTTFFPSKSIDWNGQPIPWFTYPCVEWLKAQDFSKHTVMEFGCGYGTLWWAKHAFCVHSHERNKEWRDKINAELNQRFPHSWSNVNLRESKRDYCTPSHADIYVIDGDWRMECSMNVAAMAKPGNIIIVDNVNHHPQFAEPFRNKRFTEMEFTGPCAGWFVPSSTSVFICKE